MDYPAIHDGEEGLWVWQIQVRKMPTVQPNKWDPFPSKEGYRFVNERDAGPTFDRVRNGAGAGTVRWDARLVRVFMPYMRALTECYCKYCGRQTGNYSSQAPARVLTACSDCNWEVYFRGSKPLYKQTVLAEAG